MTRTITRKQLLRYLKGKRLLAIDMEAEIIETTNPYAGDQWRKYAASGIQNWKLTVASK